MIRDLSALAATWAAMTAYLLSWLSFPLAFAVGLLGLAVVFVPRRQAVRA